MELPHTDLLTATKTTATAWANRVITGLECRGWGDNADSEARGRRDHPRWKAVAVEENSGAGVSGDVAKSGMGSSWSPTFGVRSGGSNGQDIAVSPTFKHQVTWHVWGMTSTEVQALDEGRLAVEMAGDMTCVGMSWHPLCARRGAVGAWHGACRNDVARTVRDAAQLTVGALNTAQSMGDVARAGMSWHLLYERSTRKGGREAVPDAVTLNDTLFEQAGDLDVCLAVRYAPASRSWCPALTLTGVGVGVASFADVAVVVLVVAGVADVAVVVLVVADGADVVVVVLVVAVVAGQRRWSSSLKTSPARAAGWPRGMRKEREEEGNEEEGKDVVDGGRKATSRRLPS
ncbi:hypothetical protein BKA70DRAFT_1214647 [Coprinopsis sp. MPI-PUGE-AT-0042]|nr:hypothetical protein BKA70DRAFT_1214647 [Coprinopsis sp. MPI-PUGE-AT-0042]